MRLCIKKVKLEGLPGRCLVLRQSQDGEAKGPEAAPGHLVAVGASCIGSGGRLEVGVVTFLRTSPKAQMGQAPGLRGVFLVEALNGQQGRS